MRQFLLINIVALVVTALVSCSGTKGVHYNDDGDDDGPDPSGAVFPHLEDWGDSDIHGKFVIDNGIETCVGACHGDDLNGGTGRGCKTCHKTYPHPPASGWQGLSGHGEEVRLNGSLGKCGTKCHGSDFKGGYDPANVKSCFRCHTSYPHGPSWKDEGHSEFISEGGDYNECTTMCHRPDVPAELKIAECSECHQSLEDHEDPNWSTTDHAVFISDAGGIDSADCAKCHGDNLNGGSSNISCVTSECHHNGGSGTGEWQHPAEHGSVAAADITKCQSCHAQNLKGGVIISGCDDCHHNNWKDATGKVWTDKSEHGAFAKEPDSKCALCHGDLEDEADGGIVGVTCSKACHNNLYPHGVNWGSLTQPTPQKNQHRISAKSDLSACLSCHNSVKSNDCQSCHHDGFGNWSSGGTPLHSTEAMQDINGCKTCHGANLSGGESEKSCFDCHDDGDVYGQHGGNWGEAENHGLAYLANKISCKTACHGSTLGGGIADYVSQGADYSCDSCHIEYPHQGSWYSDHGSSVLTPQDNFNETTFNNECSGCHGEVGDMNTNFPSVTPTINPVTGIETCYECHSAYPHNNNFKDTISGLGYYNWPWQYGHWLYLNFNEEYAGASVAVKISKINSVDKGCAGTSANGCHKKASRKGPIAAYNQTCTNLCHK